MMVVEVPNSPPVEGREAVLMTRVAHDLRSPLTAVKTSLGVVLANLPVDFPEVLGRMLRNIEVATDQMADVISDGAELALMQAEQTKLEWTLADLRESIRGATPTLQRQAARKGQSVEVRMPARAVNTVADGRYIERVVTNLGSAVIRRTPANSTLSVALTRDGRSAVITVGTGADLDAAMARRDDGGAAETIDLGLEVARGLVAAHGGTVWTEFNSKEALACARLPLRKELPADTDARRKPRRSEDPGVESREPVGGNE